MCSFQHTRQQQKCLGWATWKELEQGRGVPQGGNGSACWPPAPCLAPACEALLQNGEAGEPSAQPHSRHRPQRSTELLYNGMWFDPKWEGLALYTIYLHTLV